MDSKRLRAFAYIVAAIQIILVIVVLTQFQIQDMTLAKGEVYDFNKNWTIQWEDGTRQKIDELPLVADSKADEMVVIENTIPREYEGMTLSFLSADKVLKVFIDGKMVYEFGTKDERAFGHTPGSITNFIDIPDELQEGHIRIEMVSPYDNYAANISTMIIAERDIAIFHLIKSKTFSIICSIVMIFAGTLLFLLFLMQKISKKNTEGMFFLSWFCQECCLYNLIETKALSICFGNQTFYSVMLFLILMRLPILLLLYYEANLPKEYKKRISVLLFLSCVNNMVQILLQILNIADFMDMVSVSHVMMFVTIIVMLKSCYDVWKKENRGISAECIALLFMGIGAVVDVIAFYVIRVGDFGKYSRYGITIFCMIMVVIHMKKVIRSYSAIAEENARLLQRDVERVERQNKQLVIAREEAENAKIEAMEANAAKSNFLANMSHEIRTPINAVLGMDTMILQESGEQKIKEYAADIQTAGQNLLSLINDILDFSKIESGKMEIIPGDYEVASLLNDSYNIVGVRAREKNLSLTIENDSTIPRRLFGDEVRIRQIMVNLLTNAIKYTQEGGITLSMNWERIEEKELLLKISVKDTGIGITPEDQKKLFQTFQRVDEKKNRNIEGTGLGLKITKQLVEMMNGTIEVESEYGKGSVFRVEIPQKILSEEQLGDFSKQYVKDISQMEFHEKFRAPEGRILVVDDVPMNLKVMKGLLKKTGLQVETAESGKQCIQMAGRKPYHIIFLDHMMPEMDGIETLHYMQQAQDNPNKDTPIIMLTANAILGAKEEYLQMGFCDYLSKPIREQELEDMIMKYLPQELILKGDVKEEVEEGIGEKSEEKEAREASVLKKFDFLDTEMGLSYCCDSEEFYLEMLETYRNNGRYDALKELYGKQDWENYQIQVHALKSTSRSIGAVGVSEQAKQLEQAAKEKDISYIKEHHEEMMKEYEKLLEKLKVCE